MAEVLPIFSKLEQGDPTAAEQLLPLVYDELRKLAEIRLSQERPGQMLDATSLVHDAYIRLVDVERVKHWDSRGHFFSAVAEAMRRILVENARRRHRIKYGGRLRRAAITDIAAPIPMHDHSALTEALSSLGNEDAIAAQVVQLRRSSRLSHEDVAAALGISVYEARQKWTYARAWLKRELMSGR